VVSPFPPRQRNHHLPLRLHGVTTVAVSRVRQFSLQSRGKNSGGHRRHAGYRRRDRRGSVSTPLPPLDEKTADAEESASAGANIILPLRTPNSGQSTIAKVESLGRRCRTFPCDLSNTPEVSTLIARITSAGERIDILVNCAGWHVRKPAEAYTDAEVEGIWRVNLGGMFILCRDVAAHWFAEDLAGWENGSGVPRKKIINTASVLSFTGGTGLAAYTATKGGIAQVTKTFSNEWAARGINVNAIAPGYIRTDLTRDLQENPDKSVEVMERTPVGRWGETTDLAGLVVLLASGASDFMAGAVVPIDGGYTAR